MQGFGLLLPPLLLNLSGEIHKKKQARLMFLVNQLGIISNLSTELIWLMFLQFQYIHALRCITCYIIIYQSSKFLFSSVSLIESISLESDKIRMPSRQCVIPRQIMKKNHACVPSRDDVTFGQLKSI